MTDKGFGMVSRKHDGKMLQSMPMLFTYTPVEKQAQSSTASGFQQAGGHQGVFKNSGPVLEKVVGPREKQFYDQAQKGHWPPGFLPRYYGDKGDGRIGIENLMHGMRCPCVIDLKMGTATVEAGEGNFMKKMKMNTLDMFTGSSSYGVRLEGMSVYRALESGKVKTTKAQSHAISAASNLNLQDVMMFFLTDESGVRRDIAQRFLGHLERLLHHFENNNNQFLFIGSSILLIYDNDNTSPHSRWARALERATKLHPDTYASLRRKTRVDVRMIDFAHTGPLPKNMRRDEGYITGLKSIVGALRLVRKSGVAPIRPIFSLAAAAADMKTADAAANAQAAQAPLHESAPLLYPPQPAAPSAPHFNGGSYSFSHHTAGTAPLPHAHSYTPGHNPAPPLPGAAPLPHAHSYTPGYNPAPPLPGAPPPLPGGPPVIAAPPPGAYTPYQHPGAAFSASLAPPPGAYSSGSFAPVTPGPAAAVAPAPAPSAPGQAQYHTQNSGNSATHAPAHQSQQLHHQYSGAQGAYASPSLHQSMAGMTLGTGHAGASPNGGQQSSPVPAAGPYGPTFATLMGLSPYQDPSASAPVGAPQGGSRAGPPPSLV